MKMSAASEHLLAAQETQMTLIEKDSTSLRDHETYWGAVRREHGLLYAARKKGLTRLGCVPVPPCSVSAEKAKQAICMQLITRELINSQWANEPWSLCDLSWDRYQANPKGCLKKGARVVEVEYDGNSTNKTWYTTWTVVLTRKTEEEGWEAATGGADEKGLYYTTMHGDKRVYFETFDIDASRWSRTGNWTVRDNDRVFHSNSGAAPSRNDREPIEGIWTSDGRRETRGSDTPDRALPHSPSRVEPLCGAFRAGENRNRSVHRPTPYRSAPPTRNGVGPDSSTGVSCPLPVVLAPRLQEGPPSPDSTDVIPKGSDTTPRFSLLTKTGGQPCLILSGNGNQTKCFRFRCKKHFRRHYEHVTTTWWTVGERGSERQGDACILVTFKNSCQRQDFLKTVPLPPGMQAQGITMHLDY
ncbi:putative regulatory protein E2 [Rangifer tarandus papillomavirus 1]|uniref:Regulatory protein E2 n=1 Tax=Rangifer tarandus papillomavirus 1 TaxID=2773313 RepID=Q8BDR2_9PAPI|nr:putative regulatory protein E2 [Rangifer tarandus papillomavirus 1]